MEHKKTICFEIRTVANLIKRNVDKYAGKNYGSNLTEIQSWIIGYLYNNRGQDVFQRDIKSEFLIRRPTVTSILQTMEKKGLITRESMAFDARLKKLLLTPKAMEIISVIEEEVERFETELCSGVSEEELRTFFSVMDKLKKNLE